jgi:hypothetical protein
MALFELRTGERYSLELPMTVRRQNSVSLLAGITSDLSMAGVRFSAETTLEVGTALEFEIALPEEVTGGATVVIHGYGRVVRSDDLALAEQAGNSGLACVIDSYEFVRVDKILGKGGTTTCIS